MSFHVSTRDLKHRFLHVLKATFTGFACLANFATATSGQPGTLDTTFAASSPFGAGKVITPVGGNFDAVTAVALQPDGKLVLAGYCFYTGVASQFCALRYLPNGTLDPTFGASGKVLTLLGTNDGSSSLALQPDGKLVLAGTCANGSSTAFCALRYLSNGTLDPSFGTGGKVTTLMSGNSFANALARQPDGKLVLAGLCGGSSGFFCALRYLTNGTLDSSFGTNGIVTTSMGTFSEANSVAIQPDGKIVLAGTCDAQAIKKFCALRYLPDGTPDPAFGVASSGKVITAIGAVSDKARALAIQPDGKIILAGGCLVSGTLTFCSLRYLPDGSLDANFGTNGKTLELLSTSSEAYAVTLQSDGKLFLVGSCSGGAFCTVRYAPDAVALDATFGVGGIVITSVGSGGGAVAIALQPDGKFNIAGQCSNGINNVFCAARYDGGPFSSQNCKLDVDGDGAFLATTDALIYARIALGVTGNNAVAGIGFPATATRTTWPEIRNYLVTQCGLSLPQ